MSSLSKTSSERSSRPSTLLGLTARARTCADAVSPRASQSADRSRCETIPSRSASSASRARFWF